MATIGTGRAVFLHAPKTGGKYVTHVIKELGIAQSLGCKFHSVNVRRDLYTFSFVRHPLTWYQSLWAFNMSHGKWDRGPARVLAKYQSDDFNQFITNIVDDNSRGCMGSIFKRYIENSDYVGRYENLQQDLILALRLAGHSIGLISDQVINASDKTLAVYSEETRDRLLKAEARFIRRYYA